MNEPIVPWEHPLVPLLPAEVATLQRRYLSSLPVPTLTELDLELRTGLRAVGVRVGGEAVAFALIQPTKLAGYPAPLLLSIAAPGQSAFDLRRFFREVVQQHRIRAVWARSDDALLLEVLLLERWSLEPIGPLLLLSEAEPPELQEGLAFKHLSLSDLEMAQAFVERTPEIAPELKSRDELRKQLQDQVLDALLEGGTMLALARIKPLLHPHLVGLEIFVAPTARRMRVGRQLALQVIENELAADRQLVAAMTSRDEASRRLVESVGARVTAVYMLAHPASSSVTGPWGREVL